MTVLFPSHSDSITPHHNKRSLFLQVSTPFIFMISLLLIVGLVNSSVVWSAPSITSVTGQLSDGATITVTGLDFGSTGPTLLIFDNFEGGTTGTVIASNGASAPVGAWNAIGGVPQYYNQGCISGSLCFRADMSLGSWLEYAEAIIPGGDTDIFASWWLKIPTGDVVPGDGTAGTRNWKQMWLQGADSTDDDLVLSTFLPGAYYINGNNSPFGAYPALDFTIGTWTRLSAWVHGVPGGMGHVTLWQTSAAGTVKRTDQDGSVLNSGGMFERIRLNGYGRVTNNSHPMFDDFYFAVGSNAQARIEIGNSNTYTTCTNMTILTPSDWAANTITATVRQGSFTNLDNAYLYVTNANGSVNTIGYPLCPTCPRPPVNLRVQ